MKLDKDINDFNEYILNAWVFKHISLKEFLHYANSLSEKNNYFVAIENKKINI